LETRNRRLEAPAKPMLILVTLTLPMASERGPPTRAPVPNMKKVIVATRPRVWKLTPRLEAMFWSSGGRTRKRLWFREWAAPRMVKATTSRFMESVACLTG